MTHETEQHDLEDALRRMAAGLTPPEVPVAADLARGRARRRRHRLAAAGGAAAVLAVVGLGAAVVPDLVSADADRAPGFTGGDQDPLPGTETEGPSEPEVREIEPSAGPRPAGPPDGPDMEDIRTHPDLNRYRDVLAEHLDPRGEHLEKGVSNMQSGGGSQGTKLAWTNAGESGMGMVQVSVNSGWGAVVPWDCGNGWSCHDLPTVRGLTATVAEHDGVTEVAVEHEDGIVVVLAVDTLFGNNSTVPVSGIHLGERLLARTAADPRLDLPGHEGGIPPRLDQHALAVAGRLALVEEGERLETTNDGSDAQPWVEAEWAGAGGAAGTLFWEAVQGQSSGYSCLRHQYLRCQIRRVGSDEVFVGYVRPRWGGGWQATYTGPSYEVRVIFEPATAGDDLPVERALAFVTDARWQPTR